MKAWISLFALAVIFASCQAAQAVEVDFSVGSRHHGSGGVVQFRTGDSSYNTWYPERSAYYYNTPTYTNSYYVNRYPTYYTSTPAYSTFYGHRNEYRTYSSRDRHHYQNHNGWRDYRRDHRR